MKKSLSLLLALVMLLGTAAGCSETTTTEEEKSTAADASVAEETVEEIAEEEPEVTPSTMIRETFADVNYEGREFRILGLQESAHYYVNIGPTFVEIWADEYNGEIMNDAIYDRNLQTEDLLNVTLVPQWASGTDPINTLIKQAVTAGTDDFDTALQGLSALGGALQGGQLANFMNFETIDVTSPWYDQNSVNTFTLLNGTKLYWLTGDYMTCDDYAVHLIYFNKGLLENAGQELPYESVREGTWTIDRFYNTMKACEQDLNGDGQLTIKDDIVCHVENHDKIKHWIYGACEKSIDADETGNLITNTLSERQINVVERLYQYTVEKQMTYSNDDDNVLVTAFKGNHAASYCIGVAMLNQFRDMADDFGVLPMPKYDEEQETYGHYISNYVVTALVCPLTVKDRDFIGTVIETLSAFSTETVNAALFDTMLASKLVRDQESVEMLGICFATKCYDWAVDFSWGSSFASAYNNVYNNKAFNYVSEATKALKPQDKSLSRLMESIAGFED